MSRWVRSPSLVSSNRPSVSWSRRPTGNTRGSAGTRSTTVGRPWGSSAVVITPVGLLQQVVHQVLGPRPRARRRPSTSALSGSIRRPSTATSPSTRTRSSAIRSSQTRRLPMPARASTFCRRTPSASGADAATGVTAAVTGRGLAAGGEPSPASPLAPLDGSSAASAAPTSVPLAAASRRRPCSSASTTSAPGTNSPSGGRSIDAVEPEPLEEHRGRAVQHGLTGPGSRATSST